MDHRIIDILVYLAKQFQNNSFGSTKDTDFNIEFVVESLQDEGYSQTEIDSALSWYFENEKVRPQFHASFVNQNPARALRILHPIERVLINPEAYGFLVQIQQLGLISNDQLELIIDKSLSSGWEIDLPLVKAITSVVLLDTKDDYDLDDTMMAAMR